MSTDDFSVTGYPESLKIISTFNSTLDTRILSFLRRVAETVVFLAKNNIQQNQTIVTGSLLASIRILNEDPGGKWIEVGSDEFYSFWIEYGRGEVRPKSAIVLHWIDPTTGKDVFARYAGPTEPQPFMEPAVYAGVAKSKDIFIENETEQLQEILNV